MKVSALLRSILSWVFGCNSDTCKSHNEESRNNSKQRASERKKIDEWAA